MDYKLAAILLLFVAVASADDIFLGEKHEPGFIVVRDDGDDLFYWLFRSRGDPEKDPLVFWFTGGPGCSSELAVFFENGPFKINDDLTLKINPQSWNEHSNIVYIDQPIGTGFGKLVDEKDLNTDETGIADDFYTFITRWLEKYPEFKGRPFFITGESYAGHYIPAISAKIVREANKDINLIASAIGNGWVDAISQYPEYALYAYENKITSEFMHAVQIAAFAGCTGLST